MSGSSAGCSRATEYRLTCALPSEYMYNGFVTTVKARGMATRTAMTWRDVSLLLTAHARDDQSLPGAKRISTARRGFHGAATEQAHAVETQDKAPPQPCRNFISGKCRRGAFCKFAHQGAVQARSRTACYKCNKEGHHKIACPEREKEEKALTVTEPPPANAPSSGSSSETSFDDGKYDVCLMVDGAAAPAPQWMSDGGSTCNIANEEMVRLAQSAGRLLNVRSVEGKVQVGERSFVSYNQVADIKIAPDFILTNARLIPKFTTSLVSESQQLRRTGWSVSTSGARKIFVNGKGVTRLVFKIAPNGLFYRPAFSGNAARTPKVKKDEQKADNDVPGMVSDDSGSDSESSDGVSDASSDDGGKPESSRMIKGKHGMAMMAQTKKPLPSFTRHASTEKQGRSLAKQQALEARRKEQKQFKAAQALSEEKRTESDTFSFPKSSNFSVLQVDSSAMPDFLNAAGVANAGQPLISKQKAVSKPRSPEGSKHDAPRNYREAVESSESAHWKRAMGSEFSQHQTNSTFGPPVNLPPGYTPVKAKWVFKRKRDGRHKARICVQGFTMQAGRDFNNTFAPVPRQTSLRSLLALGTKLDWEMKQGDVRTAFLSTKMDAVVYVRVPDGFSEDGGPQKMGDATVHLLQIKWSARNPARFLPFPQEGEVGSGGSRGHGLTG